MKRERLMPNGLPMIKDKHITLTGGKKAYFISDHHFGLEAKIPSKTREKWFVQWLDQIKTDAGVIFILGDMFDFWYEYKHAVPKGFVRVLGKLAELTDAGIPVIFFTGNHDMWMRHYLTEELNIPVYFDPQVFQINGKNFLIGHGDGLGPGDKNYKFLKKIFKNPVAQWAYRWLHPDIGLKLAQYLSQKNKLISGEYDNRFHGEAGEWLFLYAKDYLKKQPETDYFVFGHRHLPLKMPVDNQTIYYNTGDWLNHFSYLVLDGQDLQLKYFKQKQQTNI